MKGISATKIKQMIRKIKTNGIKEKISLRTKDGKAIIRKIIINSGYTGDIEKLKVLSNLDLQGEPKPMGITNCDTRFTDVVAIYYGVDDKINLITTGNYLDTIREGDINKIIVSESCVDVSKRKTQRIAVKPGVKYKPAPGNVIRLLNGNNLELLKTLPDNSVDSVVTDGPYGLKFMNKKWDYDVPSVEFWKEVFRVLKPGGYVLSFGGTRTYHRMVVNIEDAGFEIRDQIMWIYGSGFPKSHNIGKAIDKKQGNDRVVMGTKFSGIGKAFASGEWGSGTDLVQVTKGNSEYEGWGTALKPANEPICVARKPLSEKSNAVNVLKWGTGGINIDGCRIGYKDENDKENARPGSLNGTGNNSMFGLKSGNELNELGRFPANIIFDEYAAELLDYQSGISNSGKERYTEAGLGGGILGQYDGRKTIPKPQKGKIVKRNIGGVGGASRFYYVAKTSRRERNLGLEGLEATTDKSKGGGLHRVCESCGTSILKPCSCEVRSFIVPPLKNCHPTVKPINLMTYLCRLVTPVGGTVLDPYMGSGSTGIASILEGFDFIGMEMDPEYFKIAEARINNHEDYIDLLKPSKGQGMAQAA